MSEPQPDVPPPGTREALDVVKRLEAALLALERSFAALDTDSSALQGELGRGAPAPGGGGLAALTTEEHHRLTRHLEALLEEVRQLADFLASDGSDVDPGPHRPSADARGSGSPSDPSAGDDERDQDI